MAQSTMGALAEWSPPAEEETFYKNIIRILDELYPEDWREWVVNTPTYKDLFGERISSDSECRLRFAVPTELLAKAHSDESSLSERRYKRIKRVLLTWPLGRALIYVPLNIMAKIHPVRAFNKFSEIIPVLKPQLISRHEASKRLKTNEGDSASCCSITTRASKRSHSPDPVIVTKEPKVEDYMARQSILMEKLCEMVQTTNENMNTILRMERRPLSPASSQFSSHVSSHEGNNGSATEDDWTAPPIVNEPAALEVPAPCEIIEELEDFAPGTKESEAKISKASETYINQGISCQRFNSEGWANIRYSDVQKQFQAFPAFTSLKVNSNLATVTPNWQLVGVLEKIDLCLGAVTHGLLQQRQSFQDIYKESSSEVKTYISKKFLAGDSNFRKTSDALLQYVCGKRAEVIQQRRGLYKPSNRTLNELLHIIPPSETHLFAEPKLAEFVKEQGGTNKLFPGKFRKTINSTVRNTTKRGTHTTTMFENKDFRDKPQSTASHTNYKSTPFRRPEKSRFPPRRAPQKQNRINKKF
jgi:hypothetical protein